MAPPLRSSLLSLPVELFKNILDQLPLYSRVSLILTCRGLYGAYGHGLLPEINKPTLEASGHKLYLLRLLRKDLWRTPLLLCGSCMRLHSLEKRPQTSTVLPHNCQLGTELRSGDVRRYWNPAVIITLHEIRDRIQNPRDRGISFYSGNFTTYIPFSFDIQIDVGREGLYSLTKYNVKKRRFMTSHGPSKPASVEDIANFYRHRSVEFCPHLWFGEDYVPGDGSLNEQIENAYVDRSYDWDNDLGLSFSYKHDNYLEFGCKICHVTVKTFYSGDAGFTFIVWQYFNAKRLDSWERPARINVCQPLQTDAPHFIHMSAFRRLSIRLRSWKDNILARLRS